MGMLATVLGNLFAGSRTLTPDDRPPVPATYRGVLAHEASRCTGCRTCAHVCAPGAISFAETPEVSVTWQWFIGACSFCGLCAQWCPTKAISLAEATPETALSGGELRIASTVAYRPCARCGRPHIPLPAAMTAEYLGGELIGPAAIETDYCEDCRQRMSSTRIRDAFLGPAPASEETRR